MSEVAIDTLTGEFRLLRVDILHDVGKSLNPAIDIGQVEGGFLQGAGWLTSEELWWDERGQLQTHAPSTYKIPAAGDWPADVHVRLLENTPNREDTIFRSKAVGEPPLMLAISVFHAIRDAVSSCGAPGVRPTLAAPATPESILRAIDSAAAAANGADHASRCGRSVDERLVLPPFRRARRRTGARARGIGFRARLRAARDRRIHAGRHGRASRQHRRR